MPETEANSMPSEGKPAPAFTLKSGAGDTVRLAALRGKKVVLYFYPKDDTSGCTLEANQFQENLGEFEARNAVVLGVSPDSCAKHVKFAGKYGLSFALLADEDHAVAEKYGVWVEKSMYGKKYMGIQRATFLIDEHGKIAQVWPKVKPDGHAREVLAAL
jgi:peroxiredoxin Q/BCP